MLATHRQYSEDHRHGKECDEEFRKGVECRQHNIGQSGIDAFGFRIPGPVSLDGSVRCQRGDCEIPDLLHLHAIEKVGEKVTRPNAKHQESVGPDDRSEPLQIDMVQQSVEED